MYASKCPRCGSHNLASSGEWDIVTDQFCEDCGWEKSYGHVAGFPGSQYLCRDENDLGYNSEHDLWDLNNGPEDETFDCDEDEEHAFEYDESGEPAKGTHPNVTGYTDYEESDDLPF